MGNSKINITNIFLFLFLMLFPFGQIFRIGILQPVDIAVGLGALYAIIFRQIKPEIFKYIENFLIIAGFSWVFGAALFLKIEVFYGILYFLRLTAYLYFLIYVWNFTKKSDANKKVLLNSLLSVSVISALFGWIQYFIFPALGAFKVWGWDDHLYRLAGTFLDPGFLGIIIVFGLLITVYRYVALRKRNNLIITIFLLLSLAFTYSRASYLAFFAGLLFLLNYFKKLKYFLIIAIGFILLMAALPTSKNHVLEFTRQFSAIARVENYADTINIFKTSPVFGVGYDNLCLAKAKSSGYINYGSHACSGSDSSLLFILAATGVAGITAFIYLVLCIGKNLKKNEYPPVLTASVSALLIHSLFSNSLVYSWVLGFLLILLAVNLKD